MGESVTGPVCPHVYEGMCVSPSTCATPAEGETCGCNGRCAIQDDEKFSLHKMKVNGEKSGQDIHGGECDRHSMSTELVGDMHGGGEW